MGSGCDYEVLPGDVPYGGTVMIELWRTEKTRNLCEVSYVSVTEEKRTRNQRLWE